MFRSHAYWVLFVSSYAPLFGLLSIRNRGSWAITIVLASLAIVFGALLFWLLKASTNLNEEIHDVVSVDNHTSESLVYIASYITPFVFLDFRDWRDIVAMAVLFCLMGSIYVRSDLVYINPVLNALRYGMYEIHNTSGHRLVLISKRPPTVGLIKAHPFGRTVLLGE